MFLNVRVLLLVIPQVVPEKVIVPAVGASVWLEFTVSVPVTPKFAEGWVVGVAATVRPLNVSVPLFDTVHPTALIVMVPPVGASVCDEFTVNAPAMLKLAAG